MHHFNTFFTIVTSYACNWCTTTCMFVFDIFGNTGFGCVFLCARLSVSKSERVTLLHYPHWFVWVH